MLDFHKMGNSNPYYIIMQPEKVINTCMHISQCFRDFFKWTSIKLSVKTGGYRLVISDS